MNRFKKLFGILLFVIAVPAIAFAVWWFFPQKDGDCEPLVGPRVEASSIVELSQGMSDVDRATFYHHALGSKILPETLFLALENPETGRPFFLDSDRFGLLSEPGDGNPLPIGITTAPSQVSSKFGNWLGMNCAACHVAELKYNGHRVRIIGAPSQFNVGKFTKEMAASIETTLKSPKKLYQLLKRMRHIRACREAGEFHASAGDQLLEKYKSLDDWRKSGHESEEQVDQIEEALRQELGRKSNQIDEPQSEPTAGEKAEGHAEVKLGLIEAVKALKARKQFLDKMKQISQVHPRTDPGPGRSDTWVTGRNGVFAEEFAIASNSPSSFPHLWAQNAPAAPGDDKGQSPWLTWNGSTRSGAERDIATALGMMALFDPKTHFSSVDPRALFAADRIGRRIESPPWPSQVFGEVDQIKARAGEQHYVKHCAACHTHRAVYDLSELGTDPWQVKNFNTDVNGQAFYKAFSAEMKKFEAFAIEKFQLAPEEVEKFESERPDEWRKPVGYTSWPLNGIWATAPYLHNGSVPTLYHLLLPSDERPRQFPLGHTDYDPEKLGFTTSVDQPLFEFDTNLPGNSNAGHEYGTKLDDPQRWELLEYLKTL